MFSSNQILDILSTTRDLPEIIRFAVKLHGDEMFTRTDGRVKMAFSEPVPGVYAIGHGSMEPYQTGPNKGWAGKLGRGWTDYPFDYDPTIIANIIAQWAGKQPKPPYVDTDGSRELGIRVRCLSCMGNSLPPSHDLPGWDWMDCILLFTPAYMVYHK